MRLEIVRRKNEQYAIIEVPSTSNPNKTYRVDVTNLRCDCPAWKFSKGHDKMCKHLRALGFHDASPRPKSAKKHKVANYEEVL